MQIGFNFTLGSTLDMVQRLIREKQVDYCELLIDNFLHVPSAGLAGAFACPAAFHIMHSRFLENDPEFLKDMARRLRAHIAALRPLYVSDHVAHFTHDGRNLLHLGEIDYLRDYERIRPRVALWQDLLGERIYLENYPSIMDGGWDAPEFYARLVQDTGCGVLFDASNAVCASLNCGAPLAMWDSIVASTEHFHVASYNTSMLDPSIVLDTHDGMMSEETLSFLDDRAHLFEKPGATITYERDLNIEYDSIVADLEKLRGIFGHEPACREAAAAAQ